MACAMVDGDGLQVDPAQSRKMSDEEILRARDLHVARLRREGLTWRQLGVYFGVSHVAAWKRWNRVPPAARAYCDRAASEVDRRPAGSGAVAGR